MSGNAIPVPLTPPRLGIIASAVDAGTIDANFAAEERWLDGLSWIPEPCDPALGYTFDPCGAVGNALFDSDPNATTRTHKPIGVGVGVECGTAGGITDKELFLRAERALAAQEERLIGGELYNGTRAVAAGYTQNRFLRDANATIISGGTDPVISLALLEQYAADNGAERAYIHARPKVVTYWQAYNHLRREGNLLLTALDSIVVPSEGYLGTAPTGQTASDATHEWAFVTSPVELWRSEVQILDPAPTQISSDNRRVIYASRITAAIFDPCVHAGVRVTLS